MTPTDSSAETLGFSHFIANADMVGIGLFALLLCMSIASWTVILGRLRRGAATRRHNGRFVAELAAAEASQHPRIVSEHARLAPLARIAAAELSAVPAQPDVRQGHVRHRLEDEIAQLETGQTMLASIASSAPFVGLFGTVWGIHHALLRIAATGQSSLDQVAGPIGEALIMTACGLAVAIPAGLAYNAFQRQIRLQIAQFEQFADQCAWQPAPRAMALQA